jgi:hypothetical protein
MTHHPSRHHRRLPHLKENQFNPHKSLLVSFCAALVTIRCGVGRAARQIADSIANYTTAYLKMEWDFEHSTLRS